MPYACQWSYDVIHTIAKWPNTATDGNEARAWETQNLVLTGKISSVSEALKTIM